MFQMLMFLLLTGAFVSDKVRRYLSGVDFVMFNFDFIPFNKVPLIYDFYIWMKYEQHDQNLKDIGVDYGSSVINNISFIFIFLLFTIVHIFIVLIYCKTKSKTGK